MDHHEDVLLLDHPQKLYLYVKDFGLILGTCSNIAFPVSKRLTTLLRHGHQPREEDGAIEFRRLKNCLRNQCENSQHWSDELWKSKRQEAEATRKHFNIVLTRQDKICFYLRALQGHSRRNLIDPSPKDNVLIPDNFFEYIYHIGSAINLLSITNSGLIPGGQIWARKDRRYSLQP